ncbi:MAG TPA: ThiF family adenylyltransferase, partial [Deltaproteobacteria bacterium]|nr:ThiF family adenylyltransferase [Deltaproteobacteria bacterium]
MHTYQELFARNYGIFSQAEQERLRQACILIVGCGGIGGTVAVMLARSGVGRFILVEFDDYSPSNMNRQ